MPEAFVTKKLTAEMRMLVYHGDINGKRRPFHVFAKLERNMSPRDVARLKLSMLTFIRSVYDEVPAEAEAYKHILSKIYGRQIVGPSKLLPVYNFILSLDIRSSFT